jgi:hypothetical protein
MSGESEADLKSAQRARDVARADYHDPLATKEDKQAYDAAEAIYRKAEVSPIIAQGERLAREQSQVPSPAPAAPAEQPAVVEADLAGRDANRYLAMNVPGRIGGRTLGSSPAGNVPGRIGARKAVAPPAAKPGRPKGW